jgi:MYXO-CTERM domain-containing protein
MVLLSLLLAACTPSAPHDGLAPPAARAAPLPFDGGASPLLLRFTGPETAGPMDVGDVNGDGWPDLVTAQAFQIHTYFNGPTGLARRPRTDTYIPFIAPQMALADITGDGAADMLVGQASQEGNRGQVALVLGGPDGLAPSANWVSTGSLREDGQGGELGTAVLAVGDRNGDGIDEILATMPRRGIGLLFQGESLGFNVLDVSTVPSTPAYRAPGGVALGGFLLEIRRWDGSVAHDDGDELGLSDPFAAAGVGDVDGDGQEDLAVWGVGGNPVRVRRGVGDGFSREAWTPSGWSGTIRQVVGADFDQDGYSDLAVSDEYRTWWMRGGPSGPGPRSLGSPELDFRGRQLRVADMDRDGYPDLVGTWDGIQIAFGSPWGVPPGSAERADPDLEAMDVDGLAPTAPPTAWGGHSRTGDRALATDARLFLDSDCEDLVLALAPSDPSFDGAVVIYLDAAPGGHADTSGLVDAGDPLRAAASATDGVDRAELVFPDGFTADHAVVLTADEIAAWRLADGAAFELVDLAAARDALIELAIPLDALGWGRRDPIRFFATHLTAAGRSEAFVGVEPFLGERPGWTEVTLPSASAFQPFATGPVLLDAAATVAEGGAVSLTPLDGASAAAGLDPSTLSATAAHGAVAAAGGALTYTHGGGEQAEDTVTWSVSDTCGASATAAIALTITPVNDPPALVTEDASGPSPLALSVALVDPDLPADGLATVSAAVGHGTLSSDAAGGLSVDSGAWGTAAVGFSGARAEVEAALGGLVYTADAGFVGADTLELTVSDGADAGTAAVRIDVEADPDTDTDTDSDSDGDTDTDPDDDSDPDDDGDTDDDGDSDTDDDSDDGCGCATARPLPVPLLALLAPLLLRRRRAPHGPR